MGADKIIEYSPVIICVLIFLYQQRLVVTPEQLEKKHREIMEDCESKFATIQDNLHVKETVGDIKDKVDAIYNKLIGGRGMLNFKMSELIHSDTAVANRINNMPTIQALDCMLDVIFYVLNPAREYFKVPFIVTSGYRCQVLNRKIGSKDTSQHIKGQAVDFVVKGTDIHKVFDWIKNNLEYDQLLFEKDSKGNVWIHVSFVKGKNRKQAIDNYRA